jgi:hypothetical protein
MRKQDLVKKIGSIGGIMAYGLALLVVLVIFGCGSDSKQSKQQVSDKAKAVTDKAQGSPKVVEIPQGQEPLTGKTVKEEGKTVKMAPSQLLDQEVFPAMGGKPALTQRDLQNVQKPLSKTDPLDEVVFPPMMTGGKAITRRELEAAQKEQAKIDPKDQEIFPPTKPGEKGMTLREVERLQASTPQTPITPLPIPTPPKAKEQK